MKVLRPFSPEPVTRRLNYEQFQIFMLPIFEKVLDVTDIYRQKSEVNIQIEFDMFVRFLSENNFNFNYNKRTEKLVISLESETITKASNDSIESPFVIVNDQSREQARLLHSLFQTVTNELHGETNETKTHEQLYEKLSNNSKLTLSRIIKGNRKAIVNLWCLYLQNIAILNIKSMVACHRLSLKYQNDHSPIIRPLKFIPKFGIPFGVLLQPKEMTVDEARIKLISAVNTQRGSIQNIPFSLTEKESIESGLTKDTMDIFELAERIGLQYGDFDDATVFLLEASGSSVSLLNETNDYNSNFIDYVEALGNLSVSLQNLNANESKFVIADIK